jgi:hypothetical protein
MVANVSCQAEWMAFCGAIPYFAAAKGILGLDRERAVGISLAISYKTESMRRTLSSLAITSILDFD